MDDIRLHDEGLRALLDGRDSGFVTAGTSGPGATIKTVVLGQVLRVDSSIV